MNCFRTEFERYTSTYLLKRRALGDELSDEAHRAIEEIFAERGEHLPPRPSAPILESDITRAPSKTTLALKTGAVLVFCLVAIGFAKAMAHTSAGFALAAIAVVYLLFDRAWRASLTSEQQAEEKSTEIAQRDKLNPLMLASADGDFVRVQELVSFGQDVNVLSLAGTTALMYAARNGHLHVIQFLLQHGADATIKSDSGVTALTLATKFGHNDVAQALRAPANRASARIEHAA